VSDLRGFVNFELVESWMSLSHTSLVDDPRRGWHELFACAEVLDLRNTPFSPQYIPIARLLGKSNMIIVISHSRSIRLSSLPSRRNFG
jgi:hypothetical protein